MAKDKRERERFDFWLNLLDDDEFAIAELISELKRERQFAGVVRDGIQLVADLRAGKTDVLVELFPWIPDVFADVNSSASPDGDSNGEVKRKLEQLQQLILAQNKTDVLMRPVAGPSAGGGPRALNVPKFQGPSFDDDDAIVMKKDTSTDSGKNFLKSMMNLQA